MNTLIRSSLWLVLCGVVGIGGCGSQKNQSASSKQTPAPTDTTVAAASEVVTATAPPSPDASAADVDTTAQIKTEPADESATDSATPAAEPSATSEPQPPMAPTKLATWSTQRIVVMGKGGPRFIKFDVNVGQQDLETGFQSSLASIAQELQLDFNQPVEWNELLDKPIIASGWLGNLVPSSEQREQLRGLYDKNTNGKVDETEFQAFITRGISRVAHLKLNARPSSAMRLITNSVWGPVDQDEDGELNTAELAQTAKAMLRFDFDGDNTLTPAELFSANDEQANMSAARRSSLLELKPVHAWDINQPDSLSRAVFDNYSFSDALTSEMLFAWPPGRVMRLDTDGDSTINSTELRAVGDKDLEALFQFSFPDQTQSDPEKLSVNFRSIDLSTQRSWLGHPTGGRLTLDGCIVTIVLTDEQDDAIQEAFKAQFGMFEKDAQLQAFVMQALELKEGAIETLKSSAETLQLDESRLAWRWLVAPRHWHVQIGWSASDSAWFELMDMNGDQKLVLGEIEQFGAQAHGWDRDKDGVIQSEEMPVSVVLEVKRPEARGLRSRLGGTSNEKRGANAISAPTWFTGMDYNSDGELSLSEFLGDQLDFEKFDKDRNGIIEAREVTTPQ